MTQNEANEEIDFTIMKLVDSFLPVDEAEDSDLRQLVKYAEWFTNKETGDRISNETKREILLRAERKANAPQFKYRDRVRVTEDMKWWPGGYAIKPKVGLEGMVLASRMRDCDRYIGGQNTAEDYEGLVPTRFLSTDVGYEWNEEEDDPDRKYVTYNIPNYALEKIP